MYIKKFENIKKIFENITIFSNPGDRPIMGAPNTPFSFRYVALFRN